MKLLAGPMATLSHQGLRKIIEDFGGCDEYYTEMINASSYLTHGQFELFYTLNEIAQDKIVWQLTGKDCQPMAKAAKEICSFGGIGIDLNMGCSAPEIVKTGAGIAWMIKPAEETKRLVSEVRNAIDSYNAESLLPDGTHPHRRLSVKLRLGDENFTDEGFFNFCDMLCQHGVEQLVLHPRTKKEKLSRPPRYHYVEDLAKYFQGKIPVILNGNVKDAATFNYALSAAPHCSGVMLARISAQKPWIFRELSEVAKARVVGQENIDCNTSNVGPENSAIDGKENSAGNTSNCGLKNAGIVSQENSAGNTNTRALTIDRLQVGLDYIQNLRLYQPKEFHETRMQRFFAYYCDNFSFGHYIKSKMLNCKTLEDAEKTFASYFEEMPDDRFIQI